MRPSLTELGQQHLQPLLRFRLLTTAAGLFIVLVLQFLLPSYPFTPFIVLTLLAVLFNLALIQLRSRLPDSLLMHASLVWDMLIITAMVLLTGGVEGGLVLFFPLTVFAYSLVQEQSETTRRLERERAEMNLLFDAQRATTSTLEPDQVIARLLEQMVHAFDLTSAYFVAIDQSADILTVRQEFFAEAASPEERIIPKRDYRLADFPDIKKMGVAGTSVLQRADLVLTDPEWATLNERGAQTVLRVPLKTAEEVIGYISLWSSRAPRVWSEHEIRLAETIAGHATRALANARIYAEARARTRELQALYEASQGMASSLSMQAACQASVDALRDVLGYNHVSVYFRDQESLQMQFERGYATALKTIPLTQGVMARAVRTGAPVWVVDVEADPDYIAAVPDLQSEIAVPLVHDGQAFGVINIETAKPRRLGASDLRLLTTFANQLVIAIDHVRLYEQKQQDAEVKAVLLRELSHRVKNNLAAITSLLYLALQATPLEREEILQETLARAQSMVVAHSLLARSGNARVNLLELGKQVLEDAARQLAPSDSRIAVNVRGPQAEVAPRQLITVTLILNELATNAIVHGLDADPVNPFQLRLNVERTSNGVRLMLLDNGRGLSEGFALSENAGIGLGLVRTLVEKDLKGSLTITRVEDWTCAAVEFALED